MAVHGYRVDADVLHWMDGDWLRPGEEGYAAQQALITDAYENGALVLAPGNWENGMAGPMALVLPDALGNISSLETYLAAGLIVQESGGERADGKGLRGNHAVPDRYASSGSYRGGRRRRPSMRLRRAALAAILSAVLVSAVAAACAQVSSTTGCEVPPGRFLPVLVSVGHGYGTVRAEGKTVQAAGAGKVALWGVQQADIVYESLLYRDEKKGAASTRLTLLLSDALLRGEAVECGPVRSLRDVSASLREEWQGALAFGSAMGGSYLGDAVERLKADSTAAFDLV